MRTDFINKFSAGYAVEGEITLESLHGDGGHALTGFAKGLKARAKHEIHRKLLPSDEQKRAWMDARMRQEPWAEPLQSPWVWFELAQLPEPIFTAAKNSDHHTLIVTMVFGGILKPEHGIAALTDSQKPATKR